ncbi:hypothetical protein D3C72_2519630 [compost metagenome]
MGDQLFLGGVFMAALAHHAGGHCLDPLRVRQCEHRCLGHRAVSVQTLFHLAARYQHAA